MSSPKKRSSITAASFNSIDHHALEVAAASASSTADSGSSVVTTTPAAAAPQISHQQSVDFASSIRLTSSEASNEADEIKAEPMEKILEHKQIREKRDALEKKLKTLRKNHDKEKLKLSTQKGGDLPDGAGAKKSKFYMSNKLVKRLSSKNM